MSENGPGIASLPRADVERPLVKTDSREVLKTLKPENFKDDEGTSRDIFTFTNPQGKPVRVVFYQPEELPFSQEVVKGKENFIFGNKPRYRNADEWQDFAERVRQSSKSHLSPFNHNPVILNQAVSSGESLLFVESNPLHLADLAIMLGAEGQDLRETRRNLAFKSVDQRAINWMDQIAAARLVDDSGKLIDQPDFSAEALFIKSLLGDQQAAEVLENRQKQLAHLVSERPKDSVRYKWRGEEDVEALDVKDLVAVRVMESLPVATKEGFEIRSAFDRSKEIVPRVSVHFTLNYPVESSAAASDWDAQPYAIVAPLDQMIDLNGKPAAVNAGDTYFEVSPYQPLKLPKGTVIVQPGHPEPGELFNSKGQKVFYKSRDFAPDDIAKILNNFDPRRKRLVEDLIASKVEKVASNALQSYISLDYQKLASDLSTLPLDQVLDHLISGNGQPIPLSNEARKEVKKSLDVLLSSKARELAIRQSIRDMGYEDKPAGELYWGGERKAQVQIQNLAEQLGARTGYHSSDINDTVSLLFERFQLDTLLPDKERDSMDKMEEYNQKRREIRESYALDLSPEARRLLYILGVI